jgi:hypothetical protein
MAGRWTHDRLEGSRIGCLGWVNLLFPVGVVVLEGLLEAEPDCKELFPADQDECNTTTPTAMVLFLSMSNSMF